MSVKTKKFPSPSTTKYRFVINIFNVCKCLTLVFTPIEMHLVAAHRRADLAHDGIILTFVFHLEKASKRTESILPGFAFGHCTASKPHSFDIH